MRQRGVTTAAEDDVTAQSRTAPGNFEAPDVTGGSAPAFQLATWAVFVAQVWLLDFGRPFFALYLSKGSLLFQLSISECSGS